MSASHALLGILAGGPAHGYDLKREHDARFPGAKPLAYGQVYATLARLERDGHAEIAETEQGGGPERTVYALTAAGRRTLDDWLEQVEPAGPYPADELVRKTITALHLGTDAAAFLARQRAQHMARMRELVSTRPAVVDIGVQIALDHTIAHLDADLRWLETAAARMAPQRKVLR
ncbi:MAG TPA: PadR family transcriptional regulator [Dermatophilaceae bacterium]|nr:PadR family transcriptional regulator [Dermatophilaceae bacterium]